MLNKLKEMRKNLKKKGKGFTLVELIVVIVIIAILAAVAIPRIVVFQENARKSRINSEHRQLVTAIQSYVGQAADPSDAASKLTGLNQLKPYMNVPDDKELADVLAKDGAQVAHTIANGKLTSTYTKPANNSNGLSDQKWEYNFNN